MWSEFFAAMLFVIAILYVPGYFQIRGLGLSRGAAVVCAPLVSITEYVLVGAAFALAGVHVSWVAVVAPSCLLAIVSVVALLVRGERESDEGIIDLRILAVYALVGLIVVFFVYVRAMDGAASYAQIYDNAFHLNTVRRFADAGIFSILHVSIDGALPDGAFGPITFYPAAWHVVCALVCNALSIGAGVAENVVNVVFTGIVFPLSTCAFLSALFANKKRVVALGSLCTLAVGAYPWGMMTFGPLYSNMAAFALVGSLVYIFFEMTGEGQGAKRRALWCVVFVVGSIGVAATQPNAIFTAAVILAPLACLRIWRWLISHGRSSRTAYLVVGVSLVVFAGIWLALWASPMFHAVVVYPWPSFATVYQAVVNVLLLSLRAYPVQVVLGLVIIAGLVAVSKDKQARWAIPSYLFFCVSYVVAASTDGVLKTILSGFWYNDSYRIAACVALTAIPLAAAGLDLIVGFALRAVKGGERSVRLSGVVSVAVSVMFVAAVYAPSFSVADRYFVETPMGKAEAGLAWLADPGVRKYDPAESAFVEKAKRVVDDDSLILNFPYDGSVFSYGENGLNVLYRSFGAAASDDYLTLTKGLAGVSDDDAVKSEIEDLGVGYVLLLDCYWPEGEGSIHEDLITGRESDWEGMFALDESTPGFELVLSEGDMRLYRVTVVSS